MVTYSYQQLRLMAEKGEIKPDQLLNDARFGLVRTDAIPEVAPGFAARKRNLVLARIGGIAAGAGLLATILEAAGNARLRGLPWQELRTAIFRRDNYTCAYCGHRGNSATLERA